VDRRMPPIGVQCGSRRRSGLVGPAAREESRVPGEASLGFRASAPPQGSPGSMQPGEELQWPTDVVGGIGIARPNALTTPRASDMLTHPPDRPPRSVRQPEETRRRSNPSGAVLRNTRHQHRQ
jgi:hypothetical protein